MSKKWLRNDPARPFPTDLSAIQETAKSVLWPTHEPTWFYRNRGTASERDIRRSEGYQSEENVERMAATGIQIPDRAHFFKGAGLTYERSSIEKTIQYAERARAHGLLVSVYVGGTMFTDYFFKEVPEAIEWARKDQDGQPVTYSGYQLQRWFPCLRNPGYRAYVKRVLDVAVQEVKADEIFFDNQILRHEPRSCRCKHCVAHLREMVRAKYTPEQCLIRYGFAEHPDVMPPVWSQANKPWRMDRIVLPQMQDWIDHRITSVVEFYAEMANYVKKQSPTTAVGMNIKGIHGNNRAFDNGICHGAFTDILDFTCIDGYSPGVKGGQVVSEVRLWKSSHVTHIGVVDEPHDEMAAVESQVYGYRKKIEGHGWIGGIGDCMAFTPVTQFLRANQALYHEREHLHDIAVFRSEPSTNYNCAKVHEQLIAFEQTLAVEKLPWGIIFNKQIDQLSKYRIVALPEIQAIPDAWIDALDAFMRAGGGVIVSGKAVQFNEWYRPREWSRGLGKWMKEPSDKYVKSPVGNGCLVYVPTWDVLTAWNISDWFAISGEALAPVKNRKVFLKAIADAAGEQPLSHHVTGNDHVFVEAIRASRGVDLHFINYNAANVKPRMTATVALPAGCKKARVTLTDPHQDHPVAKEIKSAVRNGTLTFSVSTPKLYGVAQVEY